MSCQLLFRKNYVYRKFDPIFLVLSFVMFLFLAKTAILAKSGHGSSKVAKIIENYPRYPFDIKCISFLLDTSHPITTQSAIITTI